jgi:hypothetical protein
MKKLLLIFLFCGLQGFSQKYTTNINENNRSKIDYYCYIHIYERPSPITITIDTNIKVSKCYKIFIGSSNDFFAYMDCEDSLVIKDTINAIKTLINAYIYEHQIVDR